MDGTVQGTIEAEEIFPTFFFATSVVINEAPSEIGITTPFDVLAESSVVTNNVFEVIDGQVVDGDFAANDAPDFDTYGGLSLDLAGDGFGVFNPAVGFFAALSGPGVPGPASVDLILDTDGSTVNLTVIPEPAAVPLFASGFLLLGAARRRQHWQRARI